MQLPFGMIFSVILIAVFIFVAFFVIRHFIIQKNCTEIGLFIKDFRDKADEVWTSAQTEEDVLSNFLPSGIEKVCFADLNASSRGNGNASMLKEFKKQQRKNMFFYPARQSCNMPAHLIEHLNIDAITSNENPYCIENKDGNVKIKLSKGFYEALVKVERRE